jgi:hypothetical protein
MFNTIADIDAAGYCGDVSGRGFKIEVAPRARSVSIEWMKWMPGNTYRIVTENGAYEVEADAVIFDTREALFPVAA